MGEALYRSLEGGSLAALVPNAGPLQLSGHWSLVLEQARSLRGSYVCQDMSGKEFPWQALDRLEAGDQTLNRHVLHQTEVPRSQSESHSFQSLCFAALVSFGNFGFGRRQEFVTIHDGYPKGGDSSWKVQLSLVIHASPDFGCKLQAGRRQYIFLFCLALEWHLCKS